jgi:hypothetical protein
MAVAEIVFRNQGNGRQRDGLPRRRLPAAGDVRAAAHQNGIMEQIIGRAVFLEDDHDVVDLAGRRRRRAVDAGRCSSAPIHADQDTCQSDKDAEQHQNFESKHVFSFY